MVGNGRIMQLQSPQLVVTVKIAYVLYCDMENHCDVIFRGYRRTQSMFRKITLC